MLETETKNPGILEAIKEVRVMSLRKTLRMIYEAKMKEIRDRDAREDYVWNEGRAQGLVEGEDRLGQLYEKLIEDRRLKDWERSVKDSKYRERLYKEYGIK